MQSFYERSLLLRPGTKKFFSAFTVFITVWLSIRYLLPLFSPFLLGTGLALAAEPMTGFLHKRLRVPRPVSAGIGVSMAFCFLAMLLLMLCAFLIRELRLLSGVLPDLEETARSGFSLVRSWLLNLSARTPESVQPLLRQNVDALFSDGASVMSKGVGYLLSLTGNLLSNIPDSTLTLGTAIISAFLISAKLPRIKRWLLRRIPKERLNAIGDTARRIRSVFGKWFLAQTKLMGVTFVILFLGFVLLKIPYALLWALGVCLVDAFPVLGTGTVLLPWSLVHLLQQDIPRAVGIASLYIVISTTRSILEPKLLGRHLGLDPLVTLMTMYAGYQIWGISGMFFAPILTVTAIQILPDRNREDKL